MKHTGETRHAQLSTDRVYRYTLSIRWRNLVLGYYLVLGAWCLVLLP